MYIMWPQRFACGISNHRHQHEQHHHSSTRSGEVKMIHILILQMKKWKLRDVKQFVLGHTASSEMGFKPGPTKVQIQAPNSCSFCAPFSFPDSNREVGNRDLLSWEPVWSLGVRAGPSPWVKGVLPLHSSKSGPALEREEPDSSLIKHQPERGASAGMRPRERAFTPVGR